MAAATSGEPISADEDRGSYTIKATTGTEGSYVYTAVIPCKQTQADWQSAVDNIGGVDAPTGVGSGKTVTITYTKSTDTLTIIAA